LIWDLAGEEEGAPIKMNPTKDASGIIYVVDGCSITSLQTALRIRQRFLGSEQQLAHRSVPEILAVNKADLRNEWQVDMDKLSSLENSGLISFTTSAKTGKGVELMFSHLARKIIAGDEIDNADDLES
jgi:small GTP-binding protein